MKLLKLILIGTIISAVAISCKKAQLTTMDAPNDDAAIIIAEALATNNYGANNITQNISDNAIMLANKSNTYCGVTVKDSVIRKSIGVNFKYDYKLNYTHKLNCNTSNLPDNITGSLTYVGKFTGPKLISNYNGTRTYRIAGLTSAADNHVFNGEYKCYNNFKFKSDTTNQGTANIYFGVKDLIVSKATHSIISGSAMIMVTGSSSKKANFTFNGKLTFSASTAILTLNGNEYNIDINTGTVIKK